MKAISHFIRQFRCQLHQPAASAAAHASPPAPQTQAGSPGGSALPRATLLPPGTRGWPGARAAPRGPPCPWAGVREHCSTGWLCSGPAQPGSVGNSSSVPKATQAGRALQPRAATLLLLARSFLFPPSLSAPCGEGMDLRLGAWAWGFRGSCFFSHLPDPNTGDGHTDPWALSHPPAIPGSHLGCVLWPRRVPGERQPRRAEPELPCPGLAPAPWGHGRVLSHPACGQYPNACMSRI